MNTAVYGHIFCNTLRSVTWYRGLVKESEAVRCPVESGFGSEGSG